MPQHLHSDGEQNLGYFAEPGVDAEIESIGQLPFEEQPAAWGELERAILSDYYPVITTYYDGMALAHGSKIGGMNVDSVWGTPTWKDIFVVQ